VLLLAHALRCHAVLRAIRPRDGVLHPENVLDEEPAQVVLRAALQLDLEGAVLPDDLTQLRAAILQRLADNALGEDGTAEQVAQFIDACFGPNIGLITEEHGSQLWADRIRDRVARRLAQQIRSCPQDATGSVEIAIDQFASTRDWIRDLRLGQTSIDLRFMNSSELVTSVSSLQWHVRRLLVRGQPGVIAGPSKSLKTSIALDLAISLASPFPSGRFLEHFEVDSPAAKVLFCSGESGQQTIRETAERICQSKGIGLRLQDLGITWCFDAPQLARPEHLNAIQRQLERNRPQVVVIDPLYLSLLAGVKDVSASNLFEIGPLLRRIAKVCLDAGATPLFVHHFNKAGTMSNQEPALEDLAFSGTAEFTRQWFLIKRRHRYQPGTGTHQLWFSYGGSAGFSGLLAVDVDEGSMTDDFAGRSWRVRVLAPDIMRAAERVQRQTVADDRRLQADAQIDDRVLAHLATVTGGEVISALRGRVSVGADRMDQAIARLVRAGRIEVTEVTRSRRSYSGYRLVEAPNRRVET
jgi:replicative DNA helicase